MWLELGRFILYYTNVHLGSWFFRVVDKKMASRIFCIGLIGCACTWLGLWRAISLEDSSVKYAYEHSAKGLSGPMVIGLLWAGHEGANFIILTVMYLCGLIALYNQPDKHIFKRYEILYMIYHYVGFFSLILWLSSPFERLLPFPPLQSIELNPLLQNHALSYHPPLLLASTALFFSIALFDLFHRHSPRLSEYRFGLLLHHIGLLILGMTAGGYWAYHVLGWGGWWFWDPVETISFLTALGGLVLLHQHMTKPEQSFFKGPFVWAIILFNLWMVRSNQIISVHSFISNWSDWPWLFFALGSLGMALKSGPAIAWNEGVSQNMIGVRLLWLIAIIGLLTPILGTLFGQSFHLSPGYYESNLLHALIFFLSYRANPIYGPALSGIWLMGIFLQMPMSAYIVYLGLLVGVKLYQKRAPLGSKTQMGALIHILVLAFLISALLQRQYSDQQEYALDTPLTYHGFTIERIDLKTYQEGDHIHYEQTLRINGTDSIRVKKTYIPSWQQETTPIVYWHSPLGSDLGFCWSMKEGFIKIFYRPFMSIIIGIALSIGMILWGWGVSSIWHCMRYRHGAGSMQLPPQRMPPPP